MAERVSLLLQENSIYESVAGKARQALHCLHDAIPKKKKKKKGIFYFFF